MSALQSLVRPTRSWHGRYKACRGCGSTRVAELADGYCQDCFADTFGPLGLDDIPPIEDEAMDDHTAYDLPAAPTLAVVPAPDLPKLFQLAWSQCFQCGALKGEGDYSDAEWVKKRPICLDCDRPVAITPRAWAKHYDWCVNCGTDQRKPMSSGLCQDCYKASSRYGYTGRKGPNLLGVRDEAEQRRRVDAYLATIDRPTPTVSAAATTDAESDVAPIVIEMGWELDNPAPLAPPSANPAVARSVADELRALLDTLAGERAALLEEQVRLAMRLAALSTQCDAVQTTIALVTR